MKFYAVVEINYVPPSEMMYKDDFGKNAYARYRKRADRSEIINTSYDPFPSFMGAVAEKKALLYFKTKKKFEEFRIFREEQEEKKDERFGISVTYNIDDERPYPFK